MPERVCLNMCAWTCLPYVCRMSAVCLLSLYTAFIKPDTEVLWIVMQFADHGSYVGVCTGAAPYGKAAP